MFKHEDVSKDDPDFFPPARTELQETYGPYVPECDSRAKNPLTAAAYRSVAYGCTRERGHEGRHAAHITDTLHVATWDDADEEVRLGRH